MNALSNQVNLIGFLGADPEVKTFDTKKRASFSVATNQSYKNDKQEWVTDTQWHNVVAWGRNSENIEKVLKKGSQVAVNGKLVYRTYDDKEGNKKYVTEVIMNDFLKITKDKKE